MATATGAGKAGTPVERQASVEELQQISLLMAERDKAIGERNDALAEVAQLREEMARAAEARLRSVAELIAQASGEIGAIPKASKMEQGGNYMYRGIEAIAERAQPEFAKLGLAIVPHRCRSLDYVDVKNQRGTEGRHYLGTWRWRIYGPGMDFVELETPGECAEWGGDKGANKAMTASRKNALTTALNLATDSADPDSFPSQEYTRGGGDPPADAKWWPSWKDVRDELRGTPEAEQLKAWCADNGFDIAAINANQQKPTVGQAQAIEAKARDLLAVYRARHTQEAGTGAETTAAGPPAAVVPESADGTADAVRAAQDAAAEAQAQDVPQGELGTWPCSACTEVVQGRIGDTCPVCNRGRLFYGRITDEEPFLWPRCERGDDAPVTVRHRWAQRRGDGRWPGQF